MKSLFHSIVFCVVALMCCQQAYSSVEYPPEQWLSGTLPVLYVNTDSCKPIISKTDYIAGSYYLDPCGVTDVKAFGSASSPLRLEIRGRGNASWMNASYLKKPYKIKLDKKTALMGMSKSKHWALMAHWEDGSVFLKDESGFEFSRRIGMEWTPRQRAVELVLNGEYMGLYFLTENVRVEKTRVNIFEQDDEATDPSEITGGWLLETDNYPDTRQIKMMAGNGDLLRLTYKSPENLSSQQLSYLTDLITRADSAIYVTDKWSRAWEDIIDLDALARFYIVNEIVDNVESFSGSCFMHKDRGENTKLLFGPVWDYGNSFGHSPLTLDCFLYENSPIRRHWITAVVQFPRFQQRVRQLWQEKHSVLFDTFNDSVMAFTEPLRQADAQDMKRWGRTYANRDFDTRRSRHVNFINRKVAFLDQQWNTTKCPLTEAVGTIDGSHEIIDALCVAYVYDGFAYVTDNHGTWAAIYIDDKADHLSRNVNLKAGSVKGFMSAANTNPTMLLDEPPMVLSSKVTPVIQKIDLSTPITLLGNTVVKVEGCFSDSVLWADGNKDESLPHIAVTSGPGLDKLEQGGQYLMTGILRLKHDILNGESGEYEFISLKSVKWVDGVGDIESDEDMVRHDYYNAVGKRSDVPFKGFNIEVTTYSNGKQMVKKIIK